MLYRVQIQAGTVGLVFSITVEVEAIPVQGYPVEGGKRQWKAEYYMKGIVDPIPVLRR